MSTGYLGISNNKGAITQLHELLMKPAVTLDELEAFSATAAGYEAWCNINSLPDYCLTIPRKTMIHQCVSAYLGCKNNPVVIEQLSPWDLTDLTDTARATEIISMTDAEIVSWLTAENDSRGMMDLVYSTSAMANIAERETVIKSICSSEFAMTMIAHSDVALGAITASETAMNAVANDEVSLTALFNVSTARKFIWGAGKLPADALMRNNAFALNWLKTNVSRSRRLYAAGYDTNNVPIVKSLDLGVSHGYILTFWGNTSSTYKDYARVGYFSGDYQSGMVQVSDSSGSTVINERAVGIRMDVRASNPTEEWADIVYVAME